jgi:flap endonuclease-1
MGIHNLNKVIKRDCLHLYDDNVPISTFSGESIAVDLSILVHKCHSTVLNDLVSKLDLLKEDINEKVTLKCTVKAVLKDISKYFVTNKIKPIIITEGETPELKKTHAHIKRNAARNSAIQRLQSILLDLRTRGIPRKDLNDKQFDELVRLKCQSLRLPREVYGAVVDAITDKGYPLLQASGEAEELCAKLCRDGLVKAVYSTDTDNLVRRCPILITKIRWDEDQETQIAETYRYHPLIHQRLGLNYIQFIDFCIMMGCDYNKRVRGMREDTIILGLFVHGSIKAFEKEMGFDFSCLNYKQCRKLLRERPLTQCCATLDELEVYFPGSIK